MDFGVVVGLRIRVRYLWDTEKKLDWTCANASIDLIVLDKVKEKKIEKNSELHRFLWTRIEKSVENEAN